MLLERWMCGGFLNLVPIEMGLRLKVYGCRFLYPYIAILILSCLRYCLDHSRGSHPFTLRLGTGRPACLRC